MTSNRGACLAGLVPPAVAVLLLAQPDLANPAAPLAGQLQPGMVLVYAADGADQPPWTIDSLRLGAALQPGADCAVVHLRRRPDSSQAEETRLCLAQDTLYRWEASSGRWTISRPVGADMVWTTARANGDVVRYETASLREEKVSGLTIPVVLTTITTTDSLGRPKQRLRERYAVGLITATGGIFEAPDSSAGGKWLTRSRFELREIRRP